MKARLGLVAVAVALAAMPTPAAWVERAYSTGFYAAFQSVMTPLSNILPFAVLDLAIVTAMLALGLVIVRRLREGQPPTRTAMRVFVDVSAVAAAVYLVFLVAWGFNYRRVPLTTQLDFEMERVDAPALRRLVAESVRQVNALHGGATDAGWPEMMELPDRLGPSFARVQQRLPSRGAAKPGIPKPTLLGAYFRRAAVDGMVDPFFLEVLVNTDVLPFERPFVVAHEWAHLAGFADESEASFVGWLVCLDGDVGSRYSAWLSLYPTLLRLLPGDEQTAVHADLATGPREDLALVRERWERSSPAVRRVGTRVYDGFLRANRVESGVASYGLVVRLMLGTRFVDGWTPAARPVS